MASSIRDNQIIDQGNIINEQSDRINDLADIVYHNGQSIRRHEKILKRTLGGSDTYKRTAAIGMVLSSVGGTVGGIAYSMKTTCWNTTGFSSIKCLGDYVLHSDTSHSDRGLNIIPWGVLIIGVCCLGYSILGLIDNKSKREKEAEIEALQSKKELENYKETIVPQLISDEIKKQAKLKKLVKKAKVAEKGAVAASKAAKIAEKAEAKIELAILVDEEKRLSEKLQKMKEASKSRSICSVS